MALLTLTRVSIIEVDYGFVDLTEIKFSIKDY